MDNVNNVSSSALLSLGAKLRNLIQKRKFKHFEYTILYGVNVFYKILYAGRSRHKVFNKISNKGLWFEKDSVSGPGSTLHETSAIRTHLPRILEQYQINSIIDAGCGDLTWLRQIDLSRVHYTGIDISETIIQHHIKNTQAERMRFLKADVCTSTLPAADLLIVRDVLVHLSNEDVQLFLANLQKSKIKYLLSSTFTQHKNINISSGGWRDRKSVV